MKRGAKLLRASRIRAAVQERGKGQRYRQWRKDNVAVWGFLMCRFEQVEGELVVGTQEGCGLGLFLYLGRQGENTEREEENRARRFTENTVDFEKIENSVLGRMR